MANLLATAFLGSLSILAIRLFLAARERLAGFLRDCGGMIFLDTDEHYLATETRSDMVAALLEHLPDGPEDSTLAALAAACLDCEEMDVIIFQEDS